MSNKFEPALHFVLEHEGGLSNDVHDRGGLTKYGISQSAHPSVDIRNLTKVDASAIYRRDYWDAVQGDYWPDAIALMLFDSAVNQGPRRSVMFLQEAAGASEDGVIGPNTKAKAGSRSVSALLHEMAVVRMMGYANLRQYSRYGHGWTRRLMSCYALARGWL